MSPMGLVNIQEDIMLSLKTNLRALKELNSSSDYKRLLEPVPIGLVEVVVGLVGRLLVACDVVLLRI